MEQSIAQDIRTRSLKKLETMGLQAADWLPLADARGLTELRPKDEIIRRLMASNAVCAWACAPEGAPPSDLIQGYVEQNGLASFFADDERNVIATARANAGPHCDQMGWKTENDWSLAWVLGYDRTPSTNGQQIDTEISQEVTFDFLRVFEDGADVLIEHLDLRSHAEVVELEDLFYCVHNAYRTAMVEGKGNIFATGVIEERRRALTWCLSPGVVWDETDLST